MRNFEYVLPEEYIEAKIIDAKNTKTMIILNVAAILIAAILIYIGIQISNAIYGKIAINNDFILNNFNEIYIYCFSFIGVLIVVTILHELIHGLFYKIYTKQKLRFGISLSCAFCGIPDIYVYRKAMIITAIAPCIIISSIFLVLMIFCNNQWMFLLYLITFASHFAGCIGDIYSVKLLLFKYKNENTLINDTGPKQTIYIKK